MSSVINSSAINQPFEMVSTGLSLSRALSLSHCPFPALPGTPSWSLLEPPHSQALVLLCCPQRLCQRLSHPPSHCQAVSQQVAPVQQGCSGAGRARAEGEDIKTNHNISLAGLVADPGKEQHSRISCAWAQGTLLVW